MVMPRSRSRSMLSRNCASISRACSAPVSLEEPVGERRLAVIDVGDDREIADVTADPLRGPATGAESTAVVRAVGCPAPGVGQFSLGQPQDLDAGRRSGRRESSAARRSRSRTRRSMHRALAVSSCAPGPAVDDPHGHRPAVLHVGDPHDRAERQRPVRGHQRSARRTAPRWHSCGRGSSARAPVASSPAEHRRRVP